MIASRFELEDSPWVVSPFTSSKVRTEVRERMEARANALTLKTSHQATSGATANGIHFPRNSVGKRKSPNNRGSIPG